MPSRSRNKVDWLRYPMKPHYIMTDSREYPLKIGDTVYGQSSRDPYRIELDAHAGGEGRPVCVRKSKYRYGAIHGINVAREGELGTAVRVKRDFARTHVAKINAKLKKAYYKAKIEMLQEKAKKVPRHA